MRTILSTLFLLLLGAVPSNLIAGELPHFYLRHRCWCAHYDYRLAYDYPWHRTTWSPTAHIRLPVMPPGSPSLGVPPAPPPAPPAWGPPLGSRRSNASERAQLSTSNPMR